MNIFLLSIGPFALLFCAVGVRLIAFVQPETFWSGNWRSSLTLFSFLLGAVALVGMLFLVITQGVIGVFGFLLALAFAISILEAEIRFAGVKNRSRQAEFLWVLAIAVKAGRPLADEVEAYARGTWGKRHRLLLDMADRLRDGETMTELVVPQGLLPESAMMQIHAGLTSQSLENSLMSAAQRVTKDLSEDQEAEFPGAGLAYPPSLLILVSLVVSFVMYYIIPKFKKIFDDFGTELPAISIAVIRISDAFVNYWFTLALPIMVYFPVGVCIFVGMAEYYGWQILLQSLLGRLFVRWHTSDVLRALSQSLAHGIPIDRALAPLVKFSGPFLLRKRLAKALDEIEDGAPCWQMLEKVGILKSQEAVVLESAERTGNLPWALKTLATHIERQRIFRVRTFLEVLQPAMLLPIGIVIAFIAIAFFMPLIKLLNDLS